MPRKRNPNTPYKAKMRLRTVDEINREIERLIRRHANKEITAAEQKNQIAALVALRAGKSEKDERPDMVPTPIIVNPVLSGCMFAPGKTLLLPYDECGESHAAFRAGGTAWQAWLEKIKPQLPLEAFEKLCAVELPTEPDNVVNICARKPADDNGNNVIA